MVSLRYLPSLRTRAVRTVPRIDGLIPMGDRSALTRGTSTMAISLHLIAALAASLLASAPAFAGELYKWVDERGVVNYSNEPPPKTKGGKPASVVEDRLSVYTPEKSVTEAIQRGKDRRPQAPASAPPPPVRSAAAAAPPPPPVAAYDPCANPNDPNCQSGILYDSSPVFNGRRRQQPLVQPQLPAGAIAGQIAGPNAIIPGQSASAPPQVQPGRPQKSGAPYAERETTRRQP